MTDWKSPQEIQKDAGIFIKFMHALFGLYVWEWFLSLDFDWAFLSGKKQFRWPLAFYFANRYLLFFAMIGIVVALDTTTEIDCEALFVFNQLAGDAAVGLASINLSIRTMAVWSHNRYITGLLILIILGHWSLILQGVLLRAKWVPGVGCVITETNNTILAATFIYSMAFDLIVLLLNAYKLLGLSVKRANAEKGDGRGAMGRSRLGRLIYGDGLIFFFIAFLSNLLATVFMLLNLNSIMSVIFNVPAAVGSTIVACRAVRRLSNFTNQNQGPEIFVSTTATGIQYRTGPNAHDLTMGSLGTGTKIGQPGVHVQMETFTRAEEASNRDLEVFRKRQEALSYTPETGNGSETDVELDVDDDGQARGHNYRV